MEKHYRAQHDGWHMCPCSYTCPIPDKRHISNIFIGYCNLGLRIGSDNRYHCICGKSFDNMDESSRHARRGYCMQYAEAKKFFTCKVCDIFCHTKYQLKRHESTQRHKDKLEQPLLCKICNIRCPSKTKYEEHIQTKKHLRNNGSETRLELECKVCNIKCLSQKQIKAHLATKKHIKKTDLFARSENDNK